MQGNDCPAAFVGFQEEAVVGVVVEEIRRHRGSSYEPRSGFYFLFKKIGRFGHGHRMAECVVRAILWQGKGRFVRNTGHRMAFGAASVILWPLVGIEMPDQVGHDMVEGRIFISFYCRERDDSSMRGLSWRVLGIISGKC